MTDPVAKRILSADMSEHEPTDHHELQERIDRLFDESDQVIVAILSKYVDEIRKVNEENPPL